MRLETLLGAALTAAAATFASASHAALLAQVGSLDTVLASATLGSSGGAESTWVASILPGYSLTGKFDDFGTSNAGEAVTDDAFSDSYAFNFGTGTCSEGTCSTAPDYYVIKIGGGGLPSGTPTHFLYQNNASLDWAYFRLSDWCTSCNVNIGRLSHITVGGSTQQVPEPGSLALIGLGLAGLAGANRLRRTKQV